MKTAFRSLRVAFLVAFKICKRNIKWIFLGAALLLSLVFIQAKFNLFYCPSCLRVGLIGTYQEHDLPFEVTSLVSEGLVKVDERQHIRPNLVSGWEVSNDATRFKFKLKDIKWVDGTAVKSQDLEFGIPNVTVSYPDDKTIQFNLKESYSPFPSLLTKPIIKKGTMLGTGPFQIIQIEKSRIFITKVILKPILSLDLPVLTIRFYPNEKTATTGFNLGEVEALAGISNPKLFNQVEVRQKVDYGKIVTIIYNTKDALLGGKNRSLRQALSFITRPVKDEEEADNPYPKTSWAYDNQAKKYLGKAEEAGAALDRARAQMSDEQLKSEILLTSTPNLSEIGKNVVDVWKSLGLNAKLRVESGIPQNFQALLITQSIPSDPDQYFLWHATQSKTNLSKLDSKRVDKDLEDGRKIISEEDRQNKYFDFQKALLEEAPATFLYFPKYNLIFLKKKGGLLNPLLGFWQF